jgi:hypothetical protein
VTVVQTNANSAESRGNVLRDVVYLIYRGTPLGEGACNFVDKANSCESTVACSDKVVEGKEILPSSDNAALGSPYSDIVPHSEEFDAIGCFWVTGCVLFFG